jgi:PTS system N-acetylgalactosamine-specific IIA component
MTGILLCGHGLWASGMASAVKLILGGQDNLEAVDFSTSDTNAELLFRLDRALEHLAFCENILILCDLFGGSPFNNALQIVMDNPRIRLIYGTNFPMVLDILTNRNRVDLPTLIEKAMDTGRRQIGHITSDMYLELDED